MTLVRTVMRRVLLIGSSGFVGQHIKEALLGEVMLMSTTRSVEAVDKQSIYFDFLQPASWANVLHFAPDVIINSAGYGVVKEQTDVEIMYDVNYRLPVHFITFLQSKGLAPFWLQIGTAFEYDLEGQRLTEQSSCVPLTHYGMSKYLCSAFLQSAKNLLPFLIVRPFAMFGPYESASKLLPYLINAQQTHQPIALSTGEQQRDYFYVKDLATFLKNLIKNNLQELTGKVFNIGRGLPVSLKDLAGELSKFIPGFNEVYWQWGKVSQRTNENSVFYNASEDALLYGLRFTPLAEAFQATVTYYFQQY